MSGCKSSAESGILHAGFNSHGFFVFVRQVKEFSLGYNPCALHEKRKGECCKQKHPNSGCFAGKLTNFYECIPFVFLIF